MTACVAAIAGAWRHLQAFLFFSLLMSSALAQQPPDAGTLLRETQPRQLPKTPPAPALAPALTPPANPSALQLHVTGFRLTGVSLIPELELQQVLASFVNKSATFDDLQQAADAVAKAYRARKFLARVYLPEQDLKDGIVTIAVIEGRLGDVRIEHDPRTRAARLSDATVRRFALSHQNPGDPVHVDALERGIALLNDLPGSSVTSVLQAGDTPGQSRLVVKATDEPLLSGYAQLDNSGAILVGEGRAVVNVSLDSPFAIGDQAAAYVAASTRLDYWRLSYGLPLGGDGIRAGISQAGLDYHYGFSGTDFRGTADTTGLNVSYPLLRGRRTNLNIALAETFQKFRNTSDLNDVRLELNDKKIRDTTLTGSGDFFDDLGGGGFNQYYLGMTFGHLNLSADAGDLTVDQAPNGPMRNGNFTKLNMSASRLQHIATRDTALVSAALQVAGNNLDSAEKFGTSGPGAVRAYGPNEGNADEGFLLALEWHHELAPGLQGIAFADTGRVRRDHSVSAATALPNTYHLSGTGFGANWDDAHGLQIHGVAAWRLGSDPIRDPATGQDSDGTKRIPHLWVTIAQTF